MLGLELRRVGKVNNLYKDVDTVLNQFGIESKGVSVEVQSQTIAHSLQHMIAKSSSFSVCTIRKCAEICGKVIPCERMNIYSAMHCINYNEMTDDYRKMLVAMVLDDFRDILNN